jgi:hypothetical protein
MLLLLLVALGGTVTVVPPPQRVTAVGEIETGNVKPADGASPVMAIVAEVD